MSPTMGRIGPFRFFFYANELEEPPHIHVRRDRSMAKFWLNQVALAKSKRFSAHELAEIEAIVHEHRVEFKEAWNDFFGY